MSDFAEATEGLVGDLAEAAEAREPSPAHVAQAESLGFTGQERAQEPAGGPESYEDDLTDADYGYEAEDDLTAADLGYEAEEGAITVHDLADADLEAMERDGVDPQEWVDAYNAEQGTDEGDAGELELPELVGEALAEGDLTEPEVLEVIDGLAAEGIEPEEALEALAEGLEAFDEYEDIREELEQAGVPIPDENLWDSFLDQTGDPEQAARGYIEYLQSSGWNGEVEVSDGEFSNLEYGTTDDPRRGTLSRATAQRVEEGDASANLRAEIMDWMHSPDGPPARARARG
jgi:hypothetical protein